MTPANHIDVYVCRACKAKTLTVTLCEVVIPYMIACEVCQAYAENQFGRGVEGGMTVRKQWYKPDAAELCTLTEATIAHVNAGGLVMREHPEPFGAPEPPKEKTELERAIELYGRTRERPIVLDSKLKIEPMPGATDCAVSIGIPDSEEAEKPGWIPTEWMRRKDFYSKRADGPVIRRCFAREDGTASYSVTMEKSGQCWVLDVDGSWRPDFPPPLRNDEYFKRHRFTTREAALSAVNGSNI